MLLNIRYFRRIYYAAGFLIFILLTGVIGYMAIEGFDFLEAFYMTVITISTVGFSEVHLLSDAGRLFTSFLIITSFGTFAYAVTSITGYMLSGELKDYFKNYRVTKEIKNISGHVVVCGYGRNGRQACETLLAHSKSFLVVEESEAMVEQLKQNRILHVAGDATVEDNMKKAGIENAKALITTLPKDSDNLFVVLTARELNKDITIISRASENNSDKKLRIAGADNVIMPDKVGGAHMATLVVTPDVNEFLDHISVQGAGETNLEEITFSSIPEDFKYKTIREMGEKLGKESPLIIGFKTPEGDYIVNPSADTEIIPDSKLFVLGTPEEIERLNRLFGVNAS